MVTQHYRWDFVGLSTDERPTPATSEKVVDGSTYYCSDTSKLYVWCKNSWYERKALGDGGGGTTYTAGDGIDITDSTISVDTDTIQPKLTAGENITITDNVISASGGSAINVVQTTGTSTTDVMSQKSVTDVFAPKNTTDAIFISNPKGDITKPASIANYSITIKTSNDTTGATGTSAIALSALASGHSSVAIGMNARATERGAIALGRYASATHVGEMNIGTSDTSSGYNSSNYRLLSGVHDPVDAHDAATKGYVDSHSGGSSVTKLSSANFNYDSNTKIALWLLPDGIYALPDSYNTVPVVGCDNNTSFNNQFKDATKTFKGFIKIDNLFYFMVNKSSQDPSMKMDRPIYFCTISSAGWLATDDTYQHAKISELPS